MIDTGTVRQICNTFPWASWAIWDDEFPDGDCVENKPGEIADFIIDRHNRLSPNVVLLGLNRSNDLDAPFMNFHAATRRHYDYRLKENIQDGGLDRLQGAYMTDLVDEINPEASTVEVTDSDADVFLEQLRLLGQTEYHVICFGNKPFQGITDYFAVDVREQDHEIMYAMTTVDDLKLHLYRVWFYGLYGANQAKVDVLENQLQQLNDRIGQN